MTNGTAAAQRASIVEQRAQVKGRKAKLIAAIEEDVLPLKEVKKRLEALDRETIRLDGELRSLQDVEAEVPEFADLEALADCFSGASRDDQREILRAFLRSLRVDYPNREVILDWLLGPDVRVRIPGLAGRLPVIEGPGAREAWLLNRF